MGKHTAQATSTYSRSTKIRIGVALVWAGVLFTILILTLNDVAGATKMSDIDWSVTGVRIVCMVFTLPMFLDFLDRLFDQIEKESK